MNDGLKGARVVLVGNFPPPFGGISVHVQALREALLARGAAVQVIDVGSRKAAHDGILPAPSPAALAAHLARFAAAGWRVHVHVSGHTPKSWLVALAGAVARRPFGPAPILTVHSGLLPLHLAQGPEARRLAWAASRLFGRIVAVSPEVARALAEIGVAQGRIRIAPAFTGVAKVGIPPASFEEARATLRPLLSCAVSPSPVYGLRVLLPALALLANRRHPDIGLALFGKAKVHSLQEDLRLYGVGKRVRVLGELEHTSALAVIAGSDLFVRPTLADGDSLSVREALSLGRPVVASAVGHRPAGTWLFRAGDSLELAEAIGDALERPLPAPMPEAGLEAVLSVYDELERRGQGGARAA